MGERGPRPGRGDPRDDSSRVRITAEQQLEGWRRRNDQPATILNRAWNQVMLGNHPFGRSQVTPDEIASFTPTRFRWTQQRIFCPQNLLIGVSGDFEERRLLARLESLFRMARLQTRAPPPPTVADRARPEDCAGRKGRDSDQHSHGTRRRAAHRECPGPTSRPRWPTSG